VLNIYRVLAKPDARRLLEALDREPFLGLTQIIELLKEEQEIVETQVEELGTLGLISRSMHASTYHLTSRGKICLILCEMIEGGSLQEGIGKLSPYVPKEFELLTENVTDSFLSMIHRGRIFQNIYLCSPWIQIMGRKRELLKKVIGDSKRSLAQRANILIISRPPDLKTKFGRKINESLRWLEKLGSDISLVKRLHTKLYIAEPGPHGGPFFAIFGSENLTGAHNIELGVSVLNNPSILNKLIAYFFDIFNTGRLYKKVESS